MIKKITIIVFSILLIGCSSVPFLEKGASEKELENAGVIHAPLSNGIVILFIDGKGKYYHGFFEKYDRYILSPGIHKLGIQYATAMSTGVTTTSTYSKNAIELEIFIDKHGEYDAVPVVIGDKWYPVVRSRETGKIVSKLTGKTYDVL